jgi:hypothetical protein
MLKPFINCTDYEPTYHHINFKIQDIKHLSEITPGVIATTERGARFHPTIGSTCWRYGYNRRLMQMVKVVIDGNRLWSSQGCQHAQGMLEHECWNTNAGTQVLEHECWNTNAGT